MKKFKPTTPGLRHKSVVDLKSLSKIAPLKRLTKKIKAHAGRNSKGRITMRHQGGGHKKLYRLVDFKHLSDNIPVKVESIEYDPYRSAFIARVVSETGARRYILAPDNLARGQKILTSASAPLSLGNRLPLSKIPVGYQIFNIEINPGRGGQIARSAGSYAEVSAHEGKYATLKMPSGEIRKILADSLATIGRASNPEHNLTVIGKAGRSRWLGIRPTVRGSAMNPVDHPYGGGEGKAQRGTRRPKDIWGNITGGRKTRRQTKRSSQLIISRRPKKKKK